MPDYDDIEYLDDDLLDDEYYNDSLNIPHLSLSGKSSSPNKKRNENDDDKKKYDEQNKDNENKKDGKNNEKKEDNKNVDNNNNQKNEQSIPNLNNRGTDSLPGRHLSSNMSGNPNDNLDFNRFRRNSPVNSASGLNDVAGRKDSKEYFGSTLEKKNNDKSKNTVDNNDKARDLSKKSNLSKNGENDIDDEEETKSEGLNLVNNLVHGIVSIVIKTMVSFLLPVLFFVIVVVMIVMIVTNTSSANETQVNDIVSRVNDSSYASELENNNDDVFVQQLREISNSYSSNGKNVNTAIVTSVFLVIISENDGLTFNDFTEDQITTVVDAMFINNSYDESEFRVKLESIFKPYFSGYSDDQIVDLIDQVFEIYESYKEIYPQSNNYTNVCAVAGSCTYQIDGITDGNKNFAKNINISNLKVRLMQGGSWNGGSCGGTWGLELPNEELVDFEKYVLGVAYAESGGNSYEALKAQVIAARSYSLGRVDFVGSSNGRKLYQENGQWILQITNCVSDQVYCDPDQGCSKDVQPSNQWGNVHSGLNNTITYKPPLAENAPLRQAAMEVNGEVLVDSKGYIVYTSFTNTNQTRWNSMANSGSDYKQILLSDYSNRGAANIKKMVCNTDGAGCNEAVGDYATWLQVGQSWSSIHLGTSNLTIGSSGCLATSIAMLIAKSGVSTNVEGSFNPGTFVEKMNSVGGIDASGNFQWYSVSQAAPNFQFVDRVTVSGKTKEEKLSYIKNLIDQGYYVVVEVMGNTGQHWVAIDSVNGDHIYMYDPATAYTDLWSRYNYNNTSVVSYFKVTG